MTDEDINRIVDDMQRKGQAWNTDVQALIEEVLRLRDALAISERVKRAMQEDFIRIRNERDAAREACARVAEKTHCAAINPEWAAAQKAIAEAIRNHGPTWPGRTACPGGGP